MEVRVWSRQVLNYSEVDTQVDGSLGSFIISLLPFTHSSLRHLSPVFLAAETSFVEDSFSTDGGGDSFGMIQVHHIQAHLLLRGHILTGLDWH